jgi:hypothetical protein
MLNNLRNIYAYVKPEGGIPLQEDCVILNRPTNRNGKRLLMGNVRKVHAQLAKLENSFYDSLFFSNKGYEEVYRECLLKYGEICDRYRTKVDMDEHYFVKLFKPLENGTIK